MSDVLKVAEYIVRSPRDIDPIKLQKLLFYSQAVSLAFFEDELFKDDFEAWQYGPVIPAVYKKYKKFKNQYIDLPEVRQTGDVLKNLRPVDIVLRSFGGKTAFALVEQCHNEKPWQEAFQQGINSIISKDAIRSFYKTVFSLS